VKSIKVTVMSKKGRQIFQEKIAVTPSVATPGDIDTSDATDNYWYSRYPDNADVNPS